MTGGRTLVLLDEPATSTDPAEGAALAEALLLHLAERGMKVVATTHYNQLKALAQTHPGFVNASVEFDVSRLAPTYRLIMNLPGGSSAIDIAGRLGLDEAILEQALQLLRREDRGLEQLLGDLQEKQRRLSDDLAGAETLKAEAERAAREAAEIAARLRDSEREERKSAKKKLTQDLLQARAQVQGVIEGLKKEERTLSKAKVAKEKLAGIEAQAHARLSVEGETVPLDRLSVGDRVEVVGLGIVGTLLEEAKGKKRVRVRMGDRDALVDVAGLTGLGRTDGPAPPKATSKPLHRTSSGTGPGGMETSSAVDVRGQAADDALDLAIAALDRAALAGEPFLRIIHGHGTGRLKTVLRDYLKASPYVAAFRAGERAEGGDGVTVVTLQ